jgi:hypothetical protein
MQVLSRHKDLKIGELLGLSRTSSKQETQTETGHEVIDKQDMSFTEQSRFSQETQLKTRDGNEAASKEGVAITEQAALSDKRKTEEDH